MNTMILTALMLVPFAASAAELQFVSFTELSRAASLSALPIPVAQDLPAAGPDALDKTKSAHKLMWATLRSLRQFRQVFGDAGTVKIADLAFWNENRLDSKSESMPAALDRLFIKLYGAKPKVENSPAALAKILETGKSEDRNLVWLGDRIAELYKFRGE